jgi:hypothetical protein
VPWMFVASCWRARWRSLVVIAVMVGLTGGFGMAALAGARRSASSPERFHDASYSRDLWVTGADDDQGPIERLLDGPLVEDHLDLVWVFAEPDPKPRNEAFFFAPAGPAGGTGDAGRNSLGIDDGILLDGRRADPADPDELVVSEVMARQYGLAPGDTLRLNTLSPAQVTAFEQGVQPTSFDGPRLALRVVGVVRTGFDIAARPDEALDFVLSPAFLDRYGDAVGLGAPSHKVRLAEVPHALGRFTDAVERAYADADGASRPGLDVTAGERVQSDAIAVITAGLVVLALVVVVAGTVWIAAAISRQQRVLAGDLEVLRALGSTHTERLAVAIATVIPGPLAGIALAPLVAVSLSPLFPVGLARRFEPDPGVHADLLVLAAGALVLLAVVAAVAVSSGANVVDRPQRALRTPAAAGLDTGQARVPLLADRVGRWLGPAPASGVRFALAAPRSLSVPVRPALVGAITGVLGLVAVAVVGTNLDRFVETPARWGTTWDVAVEAGPLDREVVLDDGAIEAAAVGRFDEQVSVDGHRMLGSTLDPVKGDLGPTVIDGRAPRGDDEVAVGRATLDELDAAIGSRVDVASRSSRTSQRTTFRIVGVVLFPTIDYSFPLADGAAFTQAGGERLGLGDPAREDAGFERLLVRWAPGVDHDAALQHLTGEVTEAFEAAGVDSDSVLASAPAFPTAPPEVNGLRDVRLFPALAAAALVVLGVISTGHALSVTVRRRRAELGVLSALGFTPRQRRLVITTQATTVACVALAVGVPLGAVAGRLVWAAIAESMGVAEDVAFPLGLLAVGLPAVLLVLNLIGALPARAAARLRVAEALRSE